MGAWSHEAFGNDTACDWASELDECNDLSTVEAAVSAALVATTSYLDADAAQRAVAAIEVISRLRGHGAESNSDTTTADAWVTRVRLAPSDALVTRALGALDVISGARSELRDLWMEGNEGEAWLAAIEDLRARLQSVPRPLPVVSATAPIGPVAQMVGRFRKLKFAHLELGATPQPLAWYNATVISGALGDVVRTRDLISRAWQTFVHMDKPQILWDLAVREAQTWAAQGDLAEALSQLESWRCAPGALEAGAFEARATGVCTAGRNLQLARDYFVRAEAIAPNDPLRRLDEALMETTGRGLPLTKGIIACRARQPEALALLNSAVSTFLETAEKGPAAWSILSYLCGWWAIALEREGQAEQAREILQVVEPILLRLHNRELILELRDLALLPPAVVIPEFPLAAPANDPPLSVSSVRTDHGGFTTLRLRGVNALKKVETLRTEFEKNSRFYPFLIGDEQDLSRLVESIDQPPDGGKAHLAAAKAFDVEGWLKDHMPKPPKAWPKEPAPPMRSPLAQYEGVQQRLKPEMVIGLAELDHPSELFARLGFGGWNDCPAPYVHAALHAHWQRHHGAQPIAVSGDTVECVVAAPPLEQSAALHLAREHHAYCYDIVE